MQSVKPRSRVVSLVLGAVHRFTLESLYVTVVLQLAKKAIASAPLRSEASSPFDPGSAKCQPTLVYADLAPSHQFRGEAGMHERVKPRNRVCTSTSCKHCKCRSWRI